MYSPRVGGTLNAQGPGIGFPSPAINVAVYGAQGDAQVVSTGCSVTASALSCNSIFLASDIGKWVEIPGAGAGSSGTDGVVTVRINGASNGLTCTVGNGNTTCNSPLGTYGTAFSAGDLLEVRVASGATTGLKDMRVTIQVQ